jgi:hypothetical protein
MNSKVLFLGLADVFISATFTVLIIWITYRIVHKLIFRNDQNDPGNIASAILLSSIIFSMGMLIEVASTPIMNAFRLFLTQDLSYQVIFLKLLQVMGIYMGTAVLFGLLVNGAGVILFTMLTRNINEWKAIRENNLSVALITGVIVIVLTLAVRNGLGLIFEAWIPYPTTPRFY